MISFKQFIIEMDKSQDPPGRDDPYDYNKGKWHQGKAVSKDKAVDTAKDTMTNIFKDLYKKKKIDEMGAGAVGGGGPTNTAGGGQVAGIGIGPQGEPGVNPKKRKPNPIIMPMGRRK
jgi:hypothetical protein